MYTNTQSNSAPFKKDYRDDSFRKNVSKGFKKFKKKPSFNKPGQSNEGNYSKFNNSGSYSKFRNEKHFDNNKYNNVKKFNNYKK